MYARSLLRLLPALSLSAYNATEPFQYWKKEHVERHLLTLLRALQLRLFLSAEHDQTLETLLKRIDADCHYAASANLGVVSRLAYACFGSSGHAYDVADYMDMMEEYEDAEIADRTFLGPSVPPQKIAEAPLWVGRKIPKPIGVLWPRLQRDLANLQGGFSFWSEWYQNRLDGKPIEWALERKRAYVPPEIIERGPRSVNGYLQRVSLGQAARPLNQVRAIFIGYGAAGKTSLIRVLMGQSLKGLGGGFTPGVDISEIRVPNTEITARLWDFGGQVVAHATHQFFLRERCLYIVVIDARSEINANDQATYWLEHVRAFGRDAPVLVVGNKCDVAGVGIAIEALRKEYSNIKGFYELSCLKAHSDYRQAFERFRNAFFTELELLGVHQLLLTDAEFATVRDVQSEASANDFLSVGRYEEIARVNGVPQERIGGSDSLLPLLDSLGVVVHFPDIPWMRDLILSPGWLTFAVYKVLYSSLARQAKGRLSEVQIVEILAKEESSLRNQHHKYPPEKCHFIAEVMDRFKISYRIPGERGAIIIPSLLELDAPPEVPAIVSGCRFRCRFERFLPRHVFPTLVVDRHDEVKGSAIWQQGAWMRHRENGAEALVEVDYQGRVISISVIGDERTSYLEMLRDDLTRILRRMPELKYLEEMFLDHTMRIEDEAVPTREFGTVGHPGVWVSFAQIRAAARTGNIEFPAPDGKMYELSRAIPRMPLKQGTARDVLPIVVRKLDALLEESRADGRHEAIMRGLAELRAAVTDVSQDRPDKEGPSDARKTTVERLRRAYDVLKDVGQGYDAVKNIIEIMDKLIRLM